MFKTKGGAGGQRLFEQCSKKLRIWCLVASLSMEPPTKIVRHVTFMGQ